jgi:hypothetical protein
MLRQLTDYDQDEPIFLHEDDRSGFSGGHCIAFNATRTRDRRHAFPPLFGA